MLDDDHFRPVGELAIESIGVAIEPRFRCLLSGVLGPASFVRRFEVVSFGVLGRCVVDILLLGQRSVMLTMLSAQ